MAPLRSSLAAACLLVGSAATQKRGFVGDGCKTGETNCTFPLLLTSCSWYYGYNMDDAYYPTTHEASTFVPMNWCWKTQNGTIPPYVNATFYLGYNEPNNVHNCNISPQLAAEKWATVMARWPASRLVSPATAGDGQAWFDAFFSNCTALYGASGCKLSALAVHDYSCDADTTMAYLEAMHARYGLPVWLTEFSCGDGAAKRPTSDHLAYMRAIVPRLEAASHVERYSWMSASSDRRGLVAGGALTEVGALYNSLL